MQYILAVLCFVVACSIVPTISMRQCAGYLKPCRTRITTRYLNGTLHSNLNGDSCRCSRRRTCPEWSESSQILSYNLISESYNVTMQMLFCNRVAPNRRCHRGETAVILSGYGHIASSLERYLCRCDDNQPLMLQERLWADDYKTYENYICANHQTVCSETSFDPCFTLTETAIQYNCTCPNPTECLDQYAGSDDFMPTLPIYGYCMLP